MGAIRSGRERYAQGAGEYGSAPGVTFIKGTVIELDPAGQLYAAIGRATCAHGCRAWTTPGTRRWGTDRNCLYGPSQAVYGTDRLSV